LNDTLDTPDGVQQLCAPGWIMVELLKDMMFTYLVGATVRTDIPNIHSLSRNMHVKFNGNRMSYAATYLKRTLRRFLAELAV